MNRQGIRPKLGRCDHRVDLRQGSRPVRLLLKRLKSIMQLLQVLLKMKKEVLSLISKCLAPAEVALFLETLRKLTQAPARILPRGRILWQKINKLSRMKPTKATKLSPDKIKWEGLKVQILRATMSNCLTFLASRTQWSAISLSRRSKQYRMMNLGSHCLTTLTDISSEAMNELTETKEATTASTDH